MHRAVAVAIAAIAAFGVVGAGAPPADAATGSEAPSAAAAQTVTIATGNDVSYPQCGQDLPARGDIAVVGVNRGTGTTTNPCLAEQLGWGDVLASDGTLRLADVYVNTANPGHLGGWWPRSDLTRTGLPVTNPQGSCVGAEDAACAYVYGWSIATDDALRRGVTRPGDRMWWLDVETMNTWSWNRAANLAVLEGMTDALRSIGASVGVYSTPRQWALIVGRAVPGRALAAAPSWVAGAVTRRGAEDDCAVAPFTPGGRVVMAQWVEHDLDHDVSCIAGVAGTEPRVTGDAVPGGRLVADPGAWGPAGVRLSYQWLRDGVEIEGATGAELVPAGGDFGTTVSVRVTGTRPGAPSLTLTSPGVLILAPVPVAPVPTMPVPSGSAPATTGTDSPAPPASTAPDAPAAG